MSTRQIRILLDFLCFIIVGVACYDTYITIYTADVILDYEYNPIAYWLLSMNNGLAIFISLKLLGLYFVTYCIKMMHYRLEHTKAAITVGSVIALFQIVVLIILIK